MKQALLVAKECSKPPAGRKRWTLDLPADEMVRLTDHQALSRETVRRCLAENDLKRWRRDCGASRKWTAHMARMEDVLDLYADESDPKRPVVCFDENSTPLIGETRHPILPEPGKPERYDCEYRRISERETLVAESTRRSDSDNGAGARIKWMFTTAPARDKLERVHPCASNESL